MCRLYSASFISPDSHIISRLWRAVCHVNFWILLASTESLPRCVMALIRGQNGLCPCPICLVSGSKLADLTTTYQKRSMAVGARIVLDKTFTKTAKSAQLKVFGLRPVEVRQSLCIDLQLIIFSECILASREFWPTWSFILWSPSCKPYWFVW